MLAVGLCGWASAWAQASAADEVVFSKQIAPILVKQCLGCHGAREFKGGYQLHTFEALLRPGDSGDAPVKPGAPDDSYLYTLLLREDKQDRMPKEADPLPPEQIALVKRWIESGARYDAGDPKATLNSILPKLPHPAAPVAYRTQTPVTALAFRPDGKELVSGGYHELLVWNPSDGKLLRRIGDVPQRTYALAVHPQKPWIALAGGTPGESGEVRLYDLDQGKLVKDLATLVDVAFDVQFSPDGTRLAACGADRAVRVFDVESGKETLRIEDHADWVLSVAWSPDGKLLASGSRDKTAKIFDAASGESQITFPGHNDVVYGVAFHPDGKSMLSVGGDRQIHYWSIAEAKREHSIGGWGKEIYRLVVDGERILTCSADKTARVHRLKERNEAFKLQNHSDWVLSLAFSAPSATLAVGTFDGQIYLWNANDGKELRKWKAAPSADSPAGGP